MTCTRRGVPTIGRRDAHCHVCDARAAMAAASALVRPAAWIAAMVAAAAAVLQIGRFFGVDPITGRPPGNAWGTWAGVLAVAAIAAIVVVLGGVAWWTVRGVRHLDALEPSGAQERPSWPSRRWLVPGLNLLWPKLLLDHLWQHTALRAAPTRREGDSTPLSLYVWWPAVVLGVLMIGAAELLMPGHAGYALEGWRTSLLLSSAGFVTLTAGALAAAVVIGEITAWHTGPGPSAGHERAFRRRVPTAA